METIDALEQKLHAAQRGVCRGEISDRPGH